MYNEGYPSGKVERGTELSNRRATVKEIVAARIKEHENHLEQLKKFQVLLEKTPEFEQLLDLSRAIL